MSWLISKIFGMIEEKEGFVMVSAHNLTSWVPGTIEDKQKTATEQIKSRRIKFGICPLCDRKGYYKIHQRYEHCRLCGMHRLLVPGQDF